MLFTDSKKIKSGLVLLVLVGLAFSLSCRFDHSEASTYAAFSEAGVFLTQGGKACCGTNISQHRGSLNGEYLAIPRDMHRNPLDVILMFSFIAMSVFFSKRLLDDIYRQSTTVGEFYIRDNPHSILFNHLAETFSRGILNPKKYNVVFAG